MKLLMLPVARRQVESNMLSDYRDFLLTDLELRKVSRWKEFPEALLDRLVQEAYRRSALQDSEGVARHGALFDQIEKMAEEVRLICNSEVAADEVLKTILSHHGFP
ncbi:MAG: hypothetical protein PSU94_05620 [Lacunisphaera sp.]|nr:hypothetical protein [Lacunisphaera sp.]